MSFRRALVVWATLLPVAGTLASPVPTEAATPHLIPTVSTQYRAVNKEYHGLGSGDWKACNYATKQRSTVTIGCAYAVSISLSVSGNVGFTDGEISSSVGWNVTYSTTTTADASVTVYRGGSGFLDVGWVYDEYTVGMEKRRCIHTLIESCGPWSSPERVSLQRAITPTFKYFGTGAK